MEFRYLGNSGMKISEITYGNWLTHGSQVENEAAVACVRAALDAGITTFDTADVYANTKAETVLGDALKGAQVTAKVSAHVLGKKVIVGKHRRRTGYRRRNGHRSRLSQIEIQSIGKKATRSTTAKKTASTTTKKEES